MIKKRKSIWPDFSFVKRYRYKLIINIGFIWTVFDIVNELTGFQILSFQQSYTPYDYNGVRAFILRELIVFFMSIVMGYLLVLKLRRIMRGYPLWIVLILKSFILLSAAFFMNFLMHFAHSIIILQLSFAEAMDRLARDGLHSFWLIQKVPYWIVLFVLTQLIIEVNEKYAPGVFFDILMGRYKEPKIEKRIVMFMDLKDSTPTAEKLGHQLYFKFIRDFIYHLSNALIEYGGRIYQYVGDEIVVSWISSHQNSRKCMDALIEARRNLQKHNEDFRRKYGVIPEFRVGIHVGDVTVGEIGVIKKDLAMSGDTMNTTARIRSACSELNQKYIVSKEFVEILDLKDWQTEDLGFIELKGKNAALELFALKI